MTPSHLPKFGVSFCGNCGHDCLGSRRGQEWAPHTPAPQCWQVAVLTRVTNGRWLPLQRLAEPSASAALLAWSPLLSHREHTI